MSIVEVAKVAGVSHSTVSRVINNRPGVSPKAASDVRRAMKKIGYTPPARRRGPQSQKSDGLHTRTVAALLVGAEIDLMRTPLVASIVHAVERQLAEHHLSMTFGQVPPDGKFPAGVSKSSIDGLLLFGQVPGPALTAKLEAFPTVWLLSKRGKYVDWGDRVHPDNEQVAQLAVDYLFERGHRRMAYLNPSSTTHTAFAERGTAFVQLAEAKGGTATILQRNSAQSDLPMRVVQNVIDNRMIDQLVKEFLEITPLPTGLFIPADIVTAMVQSSLLRYGIRVGKQVEIISCNNDASALAGLNPLPATIDLRPNVIGSRAVDQLLQRIKHPMELSRTDIRVAPRLVQFEEAVQLEGITQFEEGL